MPGKRLNALRAYHLLVTRQGGSFGWEIRYDRHAKPVRSSIEPYASHGDAARAGETALEILRSEADPDS